MAGLTALFGNAREKSQDSEKLLHLYWNRAELKKEFANLRREQYRLKDKIKQQEGEAARLQQKLEHLEGLLLDPDWCANVAVFYQLRGLALRCERKLAKFAEQLKQQREQRQQNGLLLQWNQDRARRRKAIEQQQLELRARHQELQEELDVEKKRLIAMSGFIRIFKRRSLTAILDRLAAQIEDNREAEELLLAKLEEIANEKPPENRGLDLAAKRSINLLILSFAQQLFLDFEDEELAALAKEACNKSAGAIRYGNRQECQAFLQRIHARAQAMDDSADVAELLQKRAKLIGEKALFRVESDAVPIAGSVTTVFDPGEDGTVRRSEVNVLGENYWGIARILSR